MYSDNFDSVTNNLRNSANGTFVTSDDTFPLTLSIFILLSTTGLIPEGQDLSRRQKVFFLPTDPRNESHKDPEQIDFSVPRLARYVHSAWNKHQDAVFLVDIDLAIREEFTFYQTRSNALILQGTLPAYCIPKVERLIFVSSTTTKDLIETRSQLEQRE